MTKPPSIKTGEGLRLIYGDCLEIMPTLETGSVDMVLCDLPYGTTGCKWDSSIPLAPLWGCFKRLAKPNAAIVLTASQPFTTTLIASNTAEFRYCWVWDKINRATGWFNATRQPLKAHEDVVVFYAEPPTYHPQMGRGNPYTTSGSGGDWEGFGAPRKGVPVVNTGDRFPNSLIRIKGDVKRAIGLHPTQKPVALIEYLIRTYTNPGDIVLDSCMGSGTTGVACVNTGRKFIGVEKDAAYFAMAESRIREARNQTALFGDVA